MDNSDISNKKHVKFLIEKAKEEMLCYNPNDLNSEQIEHVALKIYDNYIKTKIKNDKINAKIVKMHAEKKEYDELLNNYTDTLTRLLCPNNFSLTLVYKLHNNIPYIKGRVYWDNKQREVQIGSIPATVDKIIQLNKEGVISRIDDINENISWKDIKSNNKIKDAIKYIGKIKFKQYLLKNITFSEKNVNFKTKQLKDKLSFDFDSGKNLAFKANDSSIKNSPSSKEKVSPKKISFNWYKEWRNNNE